MTTLSEKHADSESAFLQKHLENYRDSPLYVKMVASFLQDGLPDVALKIALEGSRYHPDHATGQFLTAKAYTMRRQYHNAREILQQLVRSVPGCVAAAILLDSLKSLELDYPPFDVLPKDIAEPKSDDAFIRIKKTRKNWSWNEDLIPGMEEISSNQSIAEAMHQPHNCMPDDAQVFTPDPAENTFKLRPSRPSSIDLESLASRLETARIPAVRDLDDSQPEFTDERLSINAVDLASRPVTETLAAIYVRQGKLEEAIDAYRQLRELHRDRSKEFTLRIAEMKLMLAARTES